MVRRVKLAWLLVVQPSAFFRIQDGGLRHLEFRPILTFDLDDIEGLVIPLFRGFPGRGVHFWSYILDTGST